VLVCIPPEKAVTSEMTYTVLGGMLNPAHTRLLFYNIFLQKSAWGYSWFWWWRLFTKRVDL